MVTALPERVGRYRVVESLGQGAMGFVYRAHDPLIDRMVAIKMVRAELLEAEGGTEFRARFRREAQAAGRCTHPNIVGLYDFSDDEAAPYLVMELVEGRTLQAVVRERGALPVPEAVAIAVQILAALDYAHAAGVTHRDIKPANAVVLPDGGVKVMDFGIARLSLGGLTEAGVMVGTPSYMAPEQILGTPVDHRADLFAVGLVLYEMLQGRKPFAGETATQVLYKLAHEDLSTSPLLDEVGSPFDATLRIALARDPTARFASAGAFAAALKQMAGGEGAIPAPANPADATVLAPPRAKATGAVSEEMDSALIDQAERALASHVGPMARVFVRKAVQSASSVEGFYRTLAEHIPGDAERTRFMATGRRSVTATGTGRTGAGASETGGSGAGLRSGSGAARTAPDGPPAPLSPATVAAAQRALTGLVGPIARILVAKAAAQARTEADFHDRLVAHLDREDEKRTYRRLMQSGS